MNLIFCLFSCLIIYRYVKSFLFVKNILKIKPLFLEKENENENEKEKEGKFSSGCDERYELQNVTDTMEKKKEFVKNLEKLALLNLLYDDTMPIFNKLYFIEESIFFDNINIKNNIMKKVINVYNLTSGGLLKEWDFKF